MLASLFRMLEGRALLQKVLGNTVWQVSDKILRMIVSLAVGVWVARYLGPVDFGLLNFALAFVALFTPVADLGLQAVVVRDLVMRPTQRAQIVASAIVLRLIGSAVAVLLLTGCIAVLRADSVKAVFLVVAVGLAFFPQSYDIIDYDYQSRMHARPIVVVRSLSLVAFSLVRVALILCRADVIWFAWVIAGEALLSAVLFRIAFSSGWPGFNLRSATRAEMKYLVVSCWPLAVASLSVMLYMRIDQVMLGQMLGDHAVGVFSAAVRVSELWYFVPMAFLSAVGPALTAAYQTDAQDYERKLMQVMRVMFWLGIAVALVLTATSGRVIGLLYGPAYEEAAAVLAIHAWAGVFAAMGLASGPWFINAGLLKVRMLHTLTGAVMNVVLNSAIIPRFGVIGAAVSTLVSYSLAACLLNILSSRTRPVFFLQARAMLR